LLLTPRGDAMNHDTLEKAPATRVIHALLRTLIPNEEVCVESELLKHFPFARVGERAPRQPALRFPTTAPGSL
jgi:hypothetical protein